MGFRLGHRGGRGNNSPTLHIHRHTRVVQRDASAALLDLKRSGTCPRLPAQIGRPVTHEPAAALEQVRTPIGRLNPVLDDVRQGCLDDLAGMIRLLGGPNRGSWSGNPWGTAAILCFASIRRSCFSSSCLPSRLGNRYGLVPFTSVRAPWCARAALDHRGALG